jgi:hypothetical protein
MDEVLPWKDREAINPLASKRSEEASYLMRSLTRKGGKAANPLASNEKCSVYSFQYWFSSTESLNTEPLKTLIILGL